MRMNPPSRVGLRLVVWALRSVALGALALWFIPERRYEVSETAEQTYFALGWPEQWLVSDVTLEFLPTWSVDSGWSRKVRMQGLLTVWDPIPQGGGFGYRARKRVNPLYGPLWQTGVGAVCLAIAIYLNQFRKRPSAVEVASPMQASSPDVARLADLPRYRA
jgi:hypothetical protein